MKKALKYGTPKPSYRISTFCIQIVLLCSVFYRCFARFRCTLGPRFISILLIIRVDFSQTSSRVLLGETAA